MSETVCLSCGASTSNGLALCDLCQYASTKHFDVLSVYFRNLARWRPGRAGSRPVPGSRVLYDGEVRTPDDTGDRISDRLDEALTALSTWGRALIDDRGEFTERPLTFAQAALMDDLPDELADDKALVFTWLCAGLNHHLVSIATLEWAGEMVRDLRHHEERLSGLISLVPGWYAGGCQRKVTMENACASPLYVMPGLTWVTCPACGSTTAARDHLEVILKEACDWVAPPVRLAETLVALMDSEVSIESLRKRIAIWASRGQLETFRKTPYAPKRHRLGDVFDLITSKVKTLPIEEVVAS